MTDMLEKALEAVRRMPPDAQNAVAEAMLSLAEIGAFHHDKPDDIEPEHLAAVLEGLEQAERREFATDEEVAVALRRFKR